MKYSIVTKPPTGSTINLGHPLTRGLVACWLFNEGGGGYVNALGYPGDDGNGSRVTFSRRTSMGSGATWKKGNISFDGTTSGKITTDSMSGINTNTAFFSLEALVWVSSSTVHGPIIKCLGSDDDRGFSLGIGGTTFDDDGLNVIVLKENVAWHATAVPIKQNAWNHLVCCFNQTSSANSLNISTYLNGVLIQNLTNQANYAVNNGTCAIGGYTNGAAQRYLVAHIRKVSFYLRKLSYSEIKSLYQNPYQFLNPIQRSSLSTVEAPVTGTQFMSCMKGYW